MRIFFISSILFLAISCIRFSITLAEVSFPIGHEQWKSLIGKWHDKLPKRTYNKRVFLFGSPSILYSDYMNRYMFNAVRVHGYNPVPMMLSEYLWYWVRESGKTAPAGAEQALNYMRELYTDIWGKKEPLSMAYESLNSRYAPAVGADIRYLCSLTADSIPDAAGSMLLMPTYANAGSVIEMMKPASPVPFMHFEADGNAAPDEAERRDIWLGLLDS